MVDATGQVISQFRTVHPNEWCGDFEEAFTDQDFANLKSHVDDFKNRVSKAKKLKPDEPERKVLVGEISEKLIFLERIRHNSPNAFERIQPFEEELKDMLDDLRP